MARFLNTPFPYLDKLRYRFLHVLIIMVFNGLFIIIFEPFGISDWIRYPPWIKKLDLAGIGMGIAPTIAFSQLVIRTIIPIQIFRIGHFIYWILSEILAVFLVETFTINQNKRIMKTIRILMLVMLAASFTSVNAQKKLDPVGTWSYVANEAPQEYNKGDVLISKEGEEYKVEIKLGEDYKIKSSSVEYKENVLSFIAYIEGETVSVKSTMENDEFEGIVSYSEGTIKVSGKKK